MGVIIRLEKETFRVLTMHNKTINVNQSSITKRKPNKFAAALDSENRTMNVNDIVKVVDGTNRGQQGQVKYLYRHFAFIYSKSYSENGGYFVATVQTAPVGKQPQNSANGAHVHSGFHVAADPGQPSSSVPGESEWRRQ